MMGGLPHVDRVQLNDHPAGIDNEDDHSEGCVAGIFSHIIVSIIIILCIVVSIGVLSK